MTGGSLTATSYEAPGYTGVGSFVQTGGTNSTPYLNVAYNPGSSGTYNLSGSGYLSTSVYVGIDGTGNFVQSGGTVNSGGLFLGTQIIGVGTYTLSGNGYLSCTDQAQYVGGEAVGDTGFGSFVQTGGTNNVVNSGWGLSVGAAAGSGTYSLSGGYLVTGLEFVSNGATGLFVQSGGTNSIGTMYLGYQAGESGTYNFTGGLLSAGTEQVAFFGPGTINQSGGTNTVNRLLISNQTGGNVTYNLSGNGYLSSGTESLGYTGTAWTFTQSGGTNSTYLLYAGASSSGTYGLTGSGLLLANYEYVGYFGAGTFSQSGGTNSAGNFTIGEYAQGTYNLNGGLLIASSMTRGVWPVAFNFNGGTLQASGNFTSSIPMSLATSGGGATIDTAGYAVTLSGSLSGSGSLTKVDNGTLTLATTNTYAGNTLIGGGTLTLGNRFALEDSTLDTNGSGTLSFGTLTAATFGGLTGPGALALSNTARGAVALSVGNNNANATYSGRLSGSGSLTKIGSGIQTLTGSNTYTGATAINAGELVVNGSLVSAVTVNSGGILGGTGSLSSATVFSGGTLAPGNPLGAMDLSGTLSLLHGSIMDYELGSASNSDEVVMPSGLLELNNQQFTDFNFTTLAGFAPGTYMLIDAGSISGSLGSGTSGIIDGYQASIAVQGDELVLNVVPEPGTLALLCLAVPGILGCGWQRRRLSASCVIVLTTLAAGSVQAATVQYIVKDLGSLPSYGQMAATAINASGQISGWAYDVNSEAVTHAWVYANGHLTDLALPGSNDGAANGINSAGQVVGQSGYWTTGGPGNWLHAFLYSGGTMTDLGTLGSAGWCNAVAINAHGQIAGSNVHGEYYHAFLYSGGTTTDIGTNFSHESVARAINDNAQVAGMYWTQPYAGEGQAAFLYSAGSVSRLGTLGGVNSDCYGVNNAGQVVGYSDSSSGLAYACVWNTAGGNTTPTDLGTLPATLYSYAEGINNGGDIVGYCVNQYENNFPFVDLDGEMLNLNTLLAPGSDCTLDEAVAINDSGQIAADGANAQGQSHVFLLTPVPEPCSLGLLAISALGLFAFAWRRRRLRLAAILAIALLPAGLAQADVFHMPTGQTSLQFVTVGDPGNPPDTAVGQYDGTTGYGSVPYVYQMGKYDVTLGQYTQFLNAVARTDIYGLYNREMQGQNSGNPFLFNTQYPFGIAQGGSQGSYSYSVTGSNPQAVNMPVYGESWGDAARFCNWLQNGQPTSGTEGAGTTETGAYTLNGGTSQSALMAVTRASIATYFIPTQNEWYKAAFYDPLLNSGSGGYWTYATQSNTAPDDSLARANSESNDVNYYAGSYPNIILTDPTNYLTPVGTFAQSPSYYGTFDQSGEIFQWNKTNIAGVYRGACGGSWYDGFAADVSSSDLNFSNPIAEYYGDGFRVASVPEPGSAALLFAGGVCLLGYRWRRRKQIA